MLSGPSRSRQPPPGSQCDKWRPSTLERFPLWPADEFLAILQTVEIEILTPLSNEEASLIKEACASASSRASALLPLSDIKFRFFLDDSQTIPEWGVGGYCENSAQIDIALSPGRLADWMTNLPRTIAHEWHHLARWKGPGYGTTLPEVVISEGLAQHFEVDCFPGPPSYFSVVLTEEQRTEILRKFIIEFQLPTFDHARWFFGKGEFPFQAGYDLSFAVLGEYLADRRSTAANEVALTPGELFDTLLSISAKKK